MTSSLCFAVPYSSALTVTPKGFSAGSKPSRRSKCSSGAKQGFIIQWLLLQPEVGMSCSHALDVQATADLHG